MHCFSTEFSEGRTAVMLAITPKEALLLVSGAPVGVELKSGQPLSADAIVVCVAKDEEEFRDRLAKWAMEEDVMLGHRGPGDVL